MIERISIEKLGNEYIVKAFDDGNHILKFSSYADAENYIKKTMAMVDYEIPVYCSEEFYNKYKNMGIK